MPTEHERGDRLQRRRFLAYLLAGAAGALGAGGRTWAAPAAPPPPGAPPDKIGESGITVKPDDPAITVKAVEFPGVVTAMQGYLASPAGGETYPGILVMHDADGLSEHTRDVVRRLAKAGYVALAPDMLSRLGGTAKVGDPAKVAEAVVLLTRRISQFVQDGNSAVRYLETYPLVSKTRVGMMSFGIGAVLSWYLLAQNSDLKAGVIYYGLVPHVALAPAIGAAVLAIYGESDGHDADDLKDFDAAMKKAGQPWIYKIEPKAGRNFFDDTRRAYVPDAAKDAWKMSLDWYGSHLTG